VPPTNRGRLDHGGSVEDGEILTVAVHVPVAVERIRHARPFELPGADVEITCTGPRGQSADGKPVTRCPAPPVRCGSGASGAGMVSADRAA